LVCPRRIFGPPHDHPSVVWMGLDPEALKHRAMLLHVIRVVVDPQTSLPCAEPNCAVAVPAVDLVTARIEHE
jgi:hypothetical protein